jgi:hypothetical protein
MSGDRIAYRLAVVEVTSVFRLVKAILPLCSKKKEDLRIAIDYFGNRITGTRALERLGGQVKIGRRRGRVRRASIPWTRSAGLRFCELNNARKAREAHTVKVSSDVKMAVVNDRKNRVSVSAGSRRNTVLATTFSGDSSGSKTSRLT